MRRALSAAGVALAVVIALLLSLPVADATSNPARVTILRTAAPFHHALASDSVDQFDDGCARTALPVAPGFDATSGQEKLSILSHARECGPGSDAEVTAYTSVQIPIRVVAGQSVFGARWTVTLSGWDRISPATCSTTNTTSAFCLEDAQVIITPQTLILEDRTNGTYYRGTALPVSYGIFVGFALDCYRGSCSATTTGSSGAFHRVFDTTLWMKALGLVPTHRFALDLELIVNVNANVGAGGGAHLPAGTSASAFVDLASPGNGARLDWIESR